MESLVKWDDKGEAINKTYRDTNLKTNITETKIRNEPDREH